MAVRPGRKLTYDDYVHFPEDKRWELIDGEALVVPAPNTRHQRIITRLFNTVYNHVEEHGGGEAFVSPYDVVLSDYDVFQPDIVFIAERDAAVITEANVRGSPTWAIEVLSPSTAKRDEEFKLQRYELFAVPEYWIVDPERDQVRVYRLVSGRYDEPTVLAPPDVARPLLPEGLEVELERLLRR